MSQQQLVANTITEQNSSAFADVECPDCYAPLALYYDQQDHVRHYCENCEHEVSTRDIESEWDQSSNNTDDNNISTEYSGSLNIGIF